MEPDLVIKVGPIQVDKLKRLAELATASPIWQLDFDVPMTVPDGAGRTRPVDHAAERAIVIKNYLVGPAG